MREEKKPQQPLKIKATCCVLYFFFELNNDGHLIKDVFISGQNF